MKQLQARPPESEAGRRHVFLPAEETYCSPDPATVTTVLGSCVAICLWDKTRRFTGINHYVLPHHGREPASARYGDVAIDQLLGEMQRFGSRPENLVAKIFGGAAVLPFDSTGRSVGTENVGIALNRLRELEIRIVARRTGGARGLYIRLFTETGAVMARTIKSQADLALPLAGKRIPGL